MIVSLFAAAFSCTPALVVDGDTLRCPQPVRLAAIDAPEMPGHCRKGRVCVEGDPVAARSYLRGLTQRGPVQCVKTGEDRYRRTLARCNAAGVDFSCAMVQAGHAVQRYTRLDWCAN
jgi:micrococcal nuclease